MAKGTKRRRNETAVTTLAKNIRTYRKAKKLTMEEFANICGIDYAQLGRLERGVGNPTVSTIFDLAAALGVKPSQLID